MTGEAEIQLLQAQKHEALAQLAGNVAHDFNNLLGVISGYSDLLQDSLADRPEALAMLGEILLAVEKGARLTGQMLAHTKGLEPEFARIDLHQLLESQLGTLQAAAGPAVKIELHCAARSALADVDAAQFKQVLLNLTVNARDAIKGSGKIIFRTQNASLAAGQSGQQPLLGEGAEYVQLEICDDGLGMPQEIIPRIFDPYFTTKDNGTGLGLSAVRGIVHQHRGFISCASRENAGTTFRILLPLSTGSHALAAADPQNAVSGPRDRAAEKASILVVDDEKATRDVIAAQLSSTGYQVYTAEDGAAALRFIDEFPGVLDLLLSDINMPGMSGFSMAEQAALMQPEMAVLFMSGNPQEGEQARRALAKHRLLRKPFDRATLLAEIRDVLPAARHSL